MTIKEKIETYIGIFDDKDTLNLWLVEAVTRFIQMCPVHKLFSIEQKLSASITDKPISLTDKRLLRCDLEDGLEAPIVDPRLLNRVTDPNSIYYATKFSPVSIINHNQIIVYPNGFAYVVPFPVSLNCLATTIPGFIPEYESGIIFYVSIKGLLKIIGNNMTLNSPDYSMIIKPDAPIVPSFVYTTAELATYTNAIVNSVEGAPVYEPPTFDSTNFTITGLIDATEDTELASVQLNKLGHQLNKFQEDIQNKLNLFNGQFNTYQSELTRTIENARLLQQELLAKADKETDLHLQNNIKILEKQIDQYKMLLEKYQSEVTSYQIEMTTMTQSYYYDVQNYAIRNKNYYELLVTLKSELQEFMMYNFGTEPPKQVKE